MARPTFRELIGRGAPLVMPAAHDALSARLIECAGFAAMAISGSATLASRYALPDLGIAGLADLAAAGRDIMAVHGLACMVDGDDGYGDVKSVVRTVQVNEAMGVGALVFEDQARQVKQPGQAHALSVVPSDEIASKLRVAISARNSSDLWIIGRTDAYGAFGIDEAERRGELFLKCGVDGLFVAGVRATEDLERIARSFKGTPLTVVRYGNEGNDAPSISQLHRMGYTQIVYPLALVLPMCALFADTLAELHQATTSGAPRSQFPHEKRAREILANALELSRWEAVGETS